MNKAKVIVKLKVRVLTQATNHIRDRFALT